jgi:DNA-binding NarL/FixJ family response regulator
MTPADVPIPEGPGGLLLSRDLIFTTKIISTARELGYLVMTAGNAALAATMIERWRPRVVFVDLAAGDLVKPEAILAYKRLAPETPFVAFGSHVDTRALAAAADAGCDPVLPRSRFTSELPALIGRYLGDPDGSTPAR